MFDLMSESMFVATRQNFHENEERLREYRRLNSKAARPKARRVWHLKLALKLLRLIQSGLRRTEASLNFRAGQPVGCS